jgi:hypothetical protein
MATTLLEIGITPEDREQLLRGLHEGKYNLLLGAGASYGCNGGDGVELKDGITLSQQIAKDFNLKLNADEAKKLPLTYEEAESTSKEKLRNWLRARFIGCTPTWQKTIFQIQWERIWTFNIDDVLTQAFKHNRPTNVFSDVASFDWKEPVTPLESTPSKQQLIYLHGRASDLGGAHDGLVFSIPEYTQATRSTKQWHACFQTHYLEDPFIVCGASLVEEVDISEAIRSKNYSRAVGFPSFIVSHSLDEGQKNRMKRFSLVPVACPLEEFFSIVLRELHEYKKTVDAISSKLRPGTFARFLAQFRQLDTKDISTPAIEGTDFYGGDEPTWKDILDDLDAYFTATENAAAILDRNIARYAVLLHGDNVSGKSVALLRIAKEALRKGFKPFWFRHEDGISAEIVADYLSVDDKAILFIDNAASYLDAIGKILLYARTNGKPARVFLSLRSSRLRGFRIDISDEFRHEFRLDPIRPKDIVHLVQKRRRASRLGNHVRTSDANIITSLKKICKSELLECVSYIEFSEPIRQRVRKIALAALQDQNQREFVACVTCVHRFGFSLPLRAALVSSGLQFGSFSDVLSGHLKAHGILVHDYTGIRLRHRILSEYIWNDLFTEDERYQAMSSVVKTLAPLINPAVIRAKGIAHLILREVLDQEQVSLSTGSLALRFYEEHEPDMGWSSRYWDQRALLESRIDGHFSKAYSYSQKAISLERHPFAYTSLGTICMTHSSKLLSDNRIEAMKYFYEGEDALSTALNLTGTDSAYEHPFVKFFASATQMLRKLDPSDTEFDAILHLFKIWIKRAIDSPAYATSYGQKRLREIQALELKQSIRATRKAETRKANHS